MPADRRVNQGQKRDRLPSADALSAASDALASWWSAAYLRPDDTILPGRFATEAAASLPGLDKTHASRLENVQAAMALQRMRLRQDQGVPEWRWRPRPG